MRVGRRAREGLVHNERAKGEQRAEADARAKRVGAGAEIERQRGKNGAEDRHTIGKAGAEDKRTSRRTEGEEGGLLYIYLLSSKAGKARRRETSGRRGGQAWGLRNSAKADIRMLAIRGEMSWCSGQRKETGRTKVGVGRTNGEPWGGERKAQGRGERDSRQKAERESEICGGEWIRSYEELEKEGAMRYGISVYEISIARHVLGLYVNRALSQVSGHSWRREEEDQKNKSTTGSRGGESKGRGQAGPGDEREQYSKRETGEARGGGHREIKKETAKGGETGKTRANEVRGRGGGRQARKARETRQGEKRRENGGKRERARTGERGRAGEQGKRPKGVERRTKNVGRREGERRSEDESSRDQGEEGGVNGREAGTRRKKTATGNKQEGREGGSAERRKRRGRGRPGTHRVISLCAEETRGGVACSVPLIEVYRRVRFGFESESMAAKASSRTVHGKSRNKTRVREEKEEGPESFSKKAKTTEGRGGLGEREEERAGELMRAQGERARDGMHQGGARLRAPTSRGGRKRERSSKRGKGPRGVFFYIGQEGERDPAGRARCAVCVGRGAEEKKVKEEDTAGHRTGGEGPRQGSEEREMRAGKERNK
ncbi:Hypothetical predicted protein [Mytilus galloprovincialis]|uniref:Uncharacterized protein n=1 Tax=Mytilus galloprovincialis TaxID=29158 RepID=A0A8B6DW88_MYTGA|nr:Hypothetical predicted protein [Mytilus galloprovincialis]